MADALPISGLTLKTLPADAADIFPIYDSATGQTRGITLSNLSGGLSSTYNVKVSLTSAEILALNTSPKLCIATPGAGKVLDVISVLVAYNYGSSAYTVAAGGLALRNLGTASRQLNIIKSVLEQTFTTLTHWNAYYSDNNDQLLSNADVYLEALTSNPTGGDGTVDLYINYRVVTL
mgnify:CR=1 FL=1|tara:strand:- start:152 stop:682 length:531 start_codon:yes stop_codon:yes gene_type:complete